MKTGFNNNKDIGMLEFFFTIGILLLIFCGCSAISTAAFLGKATKIPAVVVEMIPCHSRSPKVAITAYKPVFEYSTFYGTSERFVSNVSSNPPRYKVGDKAHLFINKESKEVREGSFFGVWGAEIISGCIGIAFCTISFLLYRF